MSNNLSPSRVAELELLALRALLPRMWAALLSQTDEVRKYALDGPRMFDDVSRSAGTDDEAAFIGNYFQGILADTNALLDRFERDLQKRPRSPDAGPRAPKIETPRLTLVRDHTKDT